MLRKWNDIVPTYIEGYKKMWGKFPMLNFSQRTSTLGWFFSTGHPKSAKNQYQFQCTTLTEGEFLLITIAINLHLHHPCVRIRWVCNVDDYEDAAGECFQSQNILYFENVIFESWLDRPQSLYFSFTAKLIETSLQCSALVLTRLLGLQCFVKLHMNVQIQQ